MKLLSTASGALVLCGLLAVAAPLRAEEEDCKTVINDLNDTLGIAHKNFETMFEDLKKLMAQSADDKTKATVRNRFCSASGELLGTSRATRAVVGECGPDLAASLAGLDKSIKDMETAVEGTCK
jgi:hypothetical protein